MWDSHKTGGERCLRVVCLHGAASGRRIFEWQVGKLFGQNKGKIEFITLEGPKECTDQEAIKTMSMFQGIPMMVYDEVRFDERNWPAYQCPTETLAWLQARLAEHAPVDGVLGFSQGAAFAVMLAAQASAGIGAPLAFACLLCPHAPGYVEQLPELFSVEPLRVPVLIVRGEQEDYDEGYKETLKGRRIQKLGCRMPSEHVIRLFEDVELVTHREGHRPIPADRAACHEVIERISSFAQRWGQRGATGLEGGNPTMQAIGPGLLVRLGNSGAGADLDGPIGVVQRWRSDVGLWAIRVEETGEETLVKRGNMALQEQGSCTVCGSPTHHSSDEHGAWCCAACWVPSLRERVGQAREWQRQYQRAHSAAARQAAATRADPKTGGKNRGSHGDVFNGAGKAGGSDDLDDGNDDEDADGGGDDGDDSDDDGDEDNDEAAGNLGDGGGDDDEDGDDPVEVFNFLLRAGLLPRRWLLGGAASGQERKRPDAPVLDEETLKMLRAKPSPAQGTASLSGFEFTSAFDGGNALPGAWRAEGEEDGIRSFSTRIARDCHGSAAARTKNFWFNFGVTPHACPAVASGWTIRLVVRGMSQQADLFDNGYAPWCCSPSSGDLWRRSNGEVLYGREEGGSSTTASGETGLFQLSWLHTFGPEDVGQATYFAFCHPFSYADLLRCLESIEDAVESTPRPGFVDFHCFRPLSPRVGEQVYFHRQLIAMTPQGRNVEMLTVTQAAAEEEEPSTLCPFGLYDDLPPSMRHALAGAPTAPPLRFADRPICFVSARVHPGETPGQFAFLGFLQFLLSDDARAALLRRRFVFKLVPMLNPDGVSWGHSRTNSLGHDLNRCYQSPTPEQHEAVAVVRAMLLAWAERSELLFYLDCHGHAAVRGCFLYGNEMHGGEDFLWSVAYAHAAQLNCPHIDVENCAWSQAPQPGVGAPDHDSGRNQVGLQCGLFHAYTLECNYNCGRLVRPVSEAPGLPAASSLMQAVRGVPMSRTRGRLTPVAYDPLSWAAVGEGLAVALLDLHAEHPYSRLLSQSSPTKYIQGDKGERAHQPQLLKDLAELWVALASRHAEAAKGVSVKLADGDAAPFAHAPVGLPMEPLAEPVDVAMPRKGIICVVVLDNVCLRGCPSAAATSPVVGVRWRGDRVVVEEECADGWVRIRLSGWRRLESRCPAGSACSGPEIGFVQAFDKRLSLQVLRPLPSSGMWFHQQVRRCHAPALQAVSGRVYPPSLSARGQVNCISVGASTNAKQ